MAFEKIKTIGIDLGTSTTQLVISELTIENFASAFSVPRITISKKELLYKSEIIFTPLLNQSEIDEEKIKAFVKRAYEKAKISKHEIAMGAVILTGESARKSNSRKVARALSEYAGDFVVATAGPDLESIIAGKGAGSARLSQSVKGVVVNLDIGGGTSNLVTFDHGDVLSTACFDVGGRLMKFDANGVLTYMAPKIEQIVQTEQLSLKIGKKPSEEEVNRIVAILVEVLENSIGIGQTSPYFDSLMTNHALEETAFITHVTFSGGVADCIYQEGEHEDLNRYGDIGVRLGRAILRSKIFDEKEILRPQETIRATVVGAGSHTTDVSGSTIAYIADVLPIKNIPVLKLSNEDQKENMRGKIQEKLNWFILEQTLSNVAISFEGKKNPSFQEVQDYAEAIVLGTEKLRAQHYPLLVICEQDFAKALGHSLYTYLPKAYPFVAIDGIRVENGDYVDIGHPVAGGQVLPVIVKTLVFG